MLLLQSDPSPNNAFLSTRILQKRQFLWYLMILAVRRVMKDPQSMQIRAVLNIYCTDSMRAGDPWHTKHLTWVTDNLIVWSHEHEPLDTANKTFIQWQLYWDHPISCRTHHVKRVWTSQYCHVRPSAPLCQNGGDAQQWQAIEQRVCAWEGIALSSKGGHTAQRMREERFEFEDLRGGHSEFSCNPKGPWSGRPSEWPMRNEPNTPGRASKWKNSIREWKTNRLYPHLEFPHLWPSAIPSHTSYSTNWRPSRTIRSAQLTVTVVSRPSK